MLAISHLSCTKYKQTNKQTYIYTHTHTHTHHLTDPNDWLDKTMINHMFHTTPKACCLAIYPNSNGNCPTQNVGCTKNVLKGAPAAPYGNCKTAGWHPDMNNNKGCTNDDNVSFSLTVPCVL